MAGRPWVAEIVLCEGLYELKQFIKAEKVARELLRIHPDHPEAHRWLAMIYFDLGALAKAENHLYQLARLVPMDYSPHRLLGLIHKDFERFGSGSVWVARPESSRPGGAATKKGVVVGKLMEIGNAIHLPETTTP